MEGLDITAIIEIAGGAMILIYGLYQAFIKVFGNIGYFKKKKEERLQREREERKKEYKEFFEQGADEIVEGVLKKIDEVNEAQNERLDTLITSSNDLLRKEITNAYYKYVTFKKMPRYIKEGIYVLYKDYKSQGGNSFIDEIFEEIKTWEVVLTDIEARKKSN